MKVTYREPIVFREIEAGDRLRIRFTEAGSVQREKVVVSEAFHLAMDKVWLNEAGQPIVHRDWHDLSIVRLSDHEKNVIPLMNAPWTQEDLEAIQQWDIPDKVMAKRLGRTKASVTTRRSAIRLAFNKALLKERGLVS
jgi:hypothetical protein